MTRSTLPAVALAAGLALAPEQAASGDGGDPTPLPWSGEVPYLVKDGTIAINHVGLAPRYLTPMGRFVYFVGRGPEEGTTVRRFDPEVGLQEVVTDPCLGECRANGGVEIQALGDRLLVLACPRGLWDCQLWVTDGTNAGMELLHPDASDHVGLTRLGDEILFVAHDPTLGREWAITDGTRQGTRLLDAVPGPDGLAVDRAVSTGDRVYFSASTPETGEELWVTAGTAASTEMVLDIFPGVLSSTSLKSAIALDGRLFFRANDGEHGQELWVSDGRAAGTHLVADLVEGSGCCGPALLGTAGDAVVFAVRRVAGGDYELWRSAGSAADTYPLGPLAGEPWSDPGASHRDRLYLAGPDEAGELTRLWVTDGTPRGTRPVASLPGEIEQVVVHDGLAYSVLSDEVWATDLESFESHLVMEDSVWFLKPLGDRLYFSNGWSLGWIDDGDVETTEVGFRGDSSGVGNLTNFHGALYFDWVHGLARTDGTKSGTVDVSGPWGPKVQIGDKLFVERSRWWASADGEEFIEVTDQHTFAETPFADALWHVLPEGLDWDSYALWRADGSADGTSLVQSGLVEIEEEYCPPDPVCSARPSGSTLDGPLFVTTGRRLWSFSPDGVGTLLLDDVEPFETVEAVAGGAFAVSASGLFFQNRRLWYTDGSVAGTHLVQDGVGPGRNDLAIALGEKLLFVGKTAEHGQELWVSDATAEGTFMLRDIRPGARSSEIAELTPFGDTVLFVATDLEHGRELWVTDGTRRGTRVLIDLYEGPASSAPEELSVIDDFVFFAAADREHGLEARWTDGRSFGLVADVYPGLLSSAPREFTLAGNRVFFVARTFDDGAELRALPYGTAIFADGFESGSFSAWSAAVD